MESTRLNKFISDTGTCSRREADKLIAQGRVTVNGKIPAVGTQVTRQDKVRIDGQPLVQNTEAPIYLALNKPTGITTTTDLSQRDNIIRFVNYPERIFPIGRLDKDSEGLILLTNDGDIVNKILRAGNRHEKEYVVTVDKVITPDFISKMGSGVSILGVNTKKCVVTQEGPTKFRIILTQGMNRQIRRMCEAFGYEVVTLQRVRIMNITLAKLPLGLWRNLTETEIQDIQHMVASSKKTEKDTTIPPKTAEAAQASRRYNADRAYRMARNAGKPVPGTSAAGKRDESAGPDVKGARGSRGASKGSLSGTPAKRGGKSSGTSGRITTSRPGAKGPARGASSGRPAAGGGRKGGASKRSR